MNVIGFKTLLRKETRRFLKVPGQTVLQPVINTSLYFLVFGYALGGCIRELDGIPYVQFIVPGLVMLSVIQNALLNTASSLFVSKLQGTIVDLLVAPLTTFEIICAYVTAALIRALVVGLSVWAVGAAFTTFTVPHPLHALTFVVLVAVIFALAGMVVAIVADNFEQLNLVPAFIITPLTFLGGVFYSASMLPEPWRTITHANPILYMVEGLRYGLLGQADTSPMLGFGVVVGLALAFLALAYALIESGYKLRT